MRLSLRETLRTPAVVTLLCLATLYGVWGSTYLAIRIAVFVFPPFEMASIRFGVAGVLLIDPVVDPV